MGDWGSHPNDANISSLASQDRSPDNRQPVVIARIDALSPKPTLRQIAA